MDYGKPGDPSGCYFPKEWRLLTRAREYVADALDAHEHSDGRDLINEIDATLEQVASPASSSSAVQGDAGGVERDAVARVDGYLRRLAKSRQHDQEFIHSFDMGEPSEASLLASDLRTILAALRPQPSGETRGLGWLDVKDAPQDGSEILLNHRTHGIIQGWFSKGEWSDDTPIGPREYSGDMWILGDDLFQDEVEYGENQEVIPSGVTGWLPLDALIRPAPVASGGQHSSGEDAAWTWLNGHVECDPADRDYSADEMVDAFMAGAGRYDRWSKALERIAGEHQHRSGYCQTDITVEPALTAEEAQTVARDALSGTPESYRTALTTLGLSQQAEVRRRVLNGDKPMRHATNGRSFKLQDKVALPGVCTGVVVSLKHDTIWVLWDHGEEPPEGFRAEELELLK